MTPLKRQKPRPMGHENDLPDDQPKSPENRDDFLGAVGWVVIRFVPVAILFLIGAFAYYAGTQSH